MSSKQKRTLAVQKALLWKQEQPSLTSIEYIFLDSLVERITFQGWYEAVITWKFGEASVVPIRYDKISEIPNVELINTENGFLVNGEKVVSGFQVSRRVENIAESCRIARTRGQRPASLKDVQVMANIEK